VWERVVVVAVHPGDWCRVAGLFLLPPLAVGLWLLNRGPLTVDAAVRWAAAWAGFLVVRWLMAHWYNLTRRWRGRQSWELWVGGRQLEAVRTWRTAAVALWAIPGAWLFGLVLEWLGLLHVLGREWIWVVAVGGPLLQFGFMTGTAGLYTRVVSGRTTALAARWFDETASGEWVRIGAVSPRRARRVATALVFAWAVIVTGVSIGSLMLGLTALARHLPAGYFGLAVAILAGFMLVGLGLLAAALMGFWTRATVWWYNGWVRRGGGLRWRVERRSFPLG